MSSSTEYDTETAVRRMKADLDVRWGVLVEGRGAMRSAIFGKGKPSVYDAEILQSILRLAMDHVDYLYLRYLQDQVQKCNEGTEDRYLDLQ